MLTRAAKRQFNIVSHDITFEKFEARYMCDLNTQSDVFLSENETGPWTELADCIYQMPMGAILQTFWKTKYVCSPPQHDAQPSGVHKESAQSSEPTKNAFDILMAAGHSSQKLPAKKVTRYDLIF